MTITKPRISLLFGVACAVALGALVVNFLRTYVIVMYENRMGQRKVELLAEFLRDEMEKGGTLDLEILEKLQELRLINDARGNPIIFESTGDQSFSIRYSPPSFLGSFYRAKSNHGVVARWEKGMNEIDVVSSIPFP